MASGAPGMFQGLIIVRRLEGRVQFGVAFKAKAGLFFLQVKFGTRSCLGCRGNLAAIKMAHSTTFIEGWVNKFLLQVEGARILVSKAGVSICLRRPLFTPHRCSRCRVQQGQHADRRMEKLTDGRTAPPDGRNSVPHDNRAHNCLHSRFL